MASRQDYSKTQSNVMYSDIFINLNINPGNGQLAKHQNENAVKRSIRSLILTNKYERPFQPEIKCEVKKALFEPMGPIVADTIKTLIEEVIGNHEKRAHLIEVNVRPDYSNDAYIVTIIFSMINISEPVQMNITLNRVR